MKCKACGKHYDYREHGCCPKCGAYNRPAQRSRVGLDGVVHRLSDEEFFSNSAKRRASQSGKVCFEREECHEDTVRVTGEKWKRWAEELFVDGAPPKKAQQREARQFASAYDGRRERRGRISSGSSAVMLVAVLIAVTILGGGLSLAGAGSMVSGIISDIENAFVHQEPARPEPLEPEAVSRTYSAVGEYFIWCHRDAAVEDVTAVFTPDGVSVSLQMWRGGETDELPVLYAVQSGGGECSAKPEQWYSADDYNFTYTYWLPPLEPGTTLSARFTWFDGGDMQETEVLLIAVPENTEAAVSDAAKLGEEFIWNGIPTSVQGYTREPRGTECSMTVTVSAAELPDEPRILYFTRDGALAAGYPVGTDLQYHATTGKYVIYFHLYDYDIDRSCIAAFSGESDGVWQEAQVTLS